MATDVSESNKIVVKMENVTALFQFMRTETPIFQPVYNLTPGDLTLFSPEPREHTLFYKHRGRCKGSN